MRILLVDDEREEREGIAFLIRKFGYPLQIVTATNGREAIAVMNEQGIDILLTDVKMPVMDGLELSREVRETKPGLPIVIFSAYADFEYARQAIELHALRYLLKPIEVDEFRRLMDDIVSSVQKGQQERMLKFFRGERLSAEESRELQDWLFADGQVGRRLCKFLFVGNYYEKGEEIFLKLADKYFGSEAMLLSLYPNEGYLLLRNSAVGKKVFRKQLDQMVQTIAAGDSDEMLVLYSDRILSVRELQQQLDFMQKLQENIFGFGNRVIGTNEYIGDVDRYSLNVDLERRQLLAAIETQDVVLIRKQNERFIRAIDAEERVSRIYVQNMLYSVIQSLRQKIPGERADEALASAENIFRSRDAGTILSNYTYSMEQLLMTLESRDNDDSKLIQQIKQLVDAEYGSDLSLSDVADKVHLSPAYVSYIFKKETGQTLIKYITDIRMERARKLLEEGHMKVLQIAKVCGYENPSYFNRMFKSYYGVTPKQYREQM